MTASQINVLKKLIAAERYYFRKCVAASEGVYVSPDLRLVEVGKINGVPKKTAQLLLEIGLAETATKFDGAENLSYIRLSSCGVSRIEEPESYD